MQKQDNNRLLYIDFFLLKIEDSEEKNVQLATKFIIIIIKPLKFTESGLNIENGSL